ncbi:MAG TPA: hypothetical protein VJM83_05295 [Nitrospirota bacterium]|nr:hypothetical protein [Nitrospirota bacterium]
MVKRLIIASVAVLALSAQAFAASAQGVYVRALEGMKADIAQTMPKVEGALKGAGFTILASFENGVPEGCRYKAATVVFTREDYAAKVLAAGPDKGFALPLRLSLYEDDKGLNVAMMNPVSINRTIFQGTSMDGAAQKVVDEVVAALKAVGPAQARQAGEMRDSGAITGMGGGVFPEKVIPVAASSKSPSEVADALKKGMADPSGWHVIYVYKPSEAVAVVGVTKAKTEGRAFGIAGEKRATKSNPFPGIDHAPAFPVELVVFKKGGATSVNLVKEMWRMKLYFQDAGNWAFMKNMAMPGDIQSEIEAAVKKAVK